MPRAVQIRGQVRLPDGRPAGPGIAVTLEMRGGGGAAAQTQTDQSGKFEFPSIPQAIYEVHIRGVGFQPDFQEVDVTSMPTAYVTFVLRPEAGRNPAAVPAEGAAGTISVIDLGVPEGARKDFDSAQQLITQGKDTDKGIALLQKAVSQYPKYSEAYVLMGVAYSSKKDWGKAQKALQQATEANPKNAAAFLALGAVQNETKNFAEANKSLLKAVEMSPDSADAHFELGRSYFGLSNWEAADEQVSKAIQLRPDNAEEHVVMGNIFLRERNATSALKEFQEALRLDPKGPLAAPTQQMITRIEAALKQAEAQKKQ